MKLTAILLLTACLQVSARGYGQDITLSANQASLQNVMDQIRQQTGYSFFYNAEWLEKANPVTVNLKNVPLKDALDLLFKNQPVSYSVINNTIVLRLKTSLFIPNRDSTLADIHGRITDSLGKPLVNASVVVKGKGKQKGTQTDIDGYFMLHEVPENSTLIITYTGYISQSYKIKGGETIHIFLNKSMNPLDEVEIIAYGTTSKRLSTGDVSTINAETIAQQPVSNPLAALEGRITGLVVTQNTGVPGGSFNVQIRGQNSIASGNDPLYIVDGVPFPSTPMGSSQSTIIGYGNPMNNINPSDIASISVLKDADATAIYGSRGANGVVLITTKKGQPGQTTLNISGYTGRGSVTRMMPLLNTQEYLLMRNEAFANDGETPNPGVDYDLTQWDTTRYTNWEKDLIGGTASVNDIQASVSGGSSNTQFLLGTGFHKESTVFPGNYADQKESVHFNLNHTSNNQKFRLAISGSYVLDQNNLISGDITYQALMLPPDAPAPFDSSGNLNWGGGNFDNPYSYLLQNYKLNTDNLVSNAILSYQIIPSLQIKLSAGYNTIQLQETETFPLNSLNPAWGLTSGSSTFANNKVNTWILEPQLIYKHAWGRSKLDILIGSTFQETVNSGNLVYAGGYYNDNLLSNLAGASSVTVLSSTYSQYKYAAAFGRINYNLDDRYLVDITARRDGSSRFGPGKQFANFGAMGLGWIFSQTEFIKSQLPFISFGKLRASYGITGNDQIGNYQYMDLWTPSSYPYHGISGLTTTSLMNADFSWETNKKFEIGLEAGFLKDHILAKFSWYQNRSSDQLVGYPLPLITGFTSVQANSPALVQNRGFEIELNTVNIHNSNFSWSSSFTLTIPKNALLAYSNLAGSPYSNIYVIGQPLSVVKTFRGAGVNDTTGVYQFINQKGSITYSPNFFTDRTVYNNINPVWYAGLQNSISYKGIQFDFFFQIVQQTGKNYFHGAAFPAPGFYGNQPAWVMNRWQEAGDQSSTEKFTQDYSTPAYQTYSSNAYYGDKGFSDASFIRLKNISLSYRFPQPWIEKMKLSNLRIFIQGQNVLTITHYMGMDPENQSLNNLPPLKVWTAGLQLSL